METTEQAQGGLKKKVATGVAVGLATTAAAGVAKKLMSNGDDDQRENVESRGRQAAEGAKSQASSSTRRATGSTSRQAKSGARKGATQTRKRASQTRSTASSKARSARSASSRTREQTKEQLYAQAKRLKVQGRSNMTKAQLQRAVARAK